MYLAQPLFHHCQTINNFVSGWSQEKDNQWGWRPNKKESQNKEIMRMQRTLTHSALFLWNSDWTFPRPASTFVRWSLLHKRRGLHAVECSWEYGVINVYNIVFCATICAQCSCCLVDYQLLRGTFLGQQNLGVTRGWWKQKFCACFSDLAIFPKINLQFGVFIAETDITYVRNMW